VASDDNIAVWRVDGAEEAGYAANLHRLGTLFIGTKRSQCNVSAFDFYVLAGETARRATGWERV
jgi:hypothetical protein